MDPIVRIAAGFVAALTIVMIARGARSLSASGAVAAAVTGTVAVAAGWDWGVLLVAYFTTASVLSRIGRRRKLALTASVLAKAGPRDAWQVLSNGLPFAVAAACAALFGPSAMLMAIAGGSLAASASDTWATEIGTLVGQRPRSILGGRAVDVGESGGITAAGSAASVAGALFVAGIALLIRWPPALFLPLTVAGIAGSVADSVIGATLQRRYWCDACGQATEMRTHTCGSATRPIGGIAYVDNDMVNLAATIVGGVTAALVAGALA